MLLSPFRPLAPLAHGAPPPAHTEDRGRPFGQPGARPLEYDRGGQQHWAQPPHLSSQSVANLFTWPKEGANALRRSASVARKSL